ncbi:MAG TPA: M20/M25/M40 family metallo-hydrolase [Candidatus Sulfopaludibacter sp.]|jgi:hypothetical protein|nr:M20/M25/M40 family metallo-hydrolase [Candidatus Sulfopaludibacter sp.]
MRKRMVGIGAVLCACLLLQAQERERVSLSVAHQIRDEAFGRNSKVMDTSFYLTDVHGPRLTGSPQAKRAAEWAVQKLTEWGLVNAKMEPWGSSFGKGWECTRYVAMMKAPEFQPIIGFAAPWSSSTAGDVTGDAVLAIINTPEELEQWKGKLKGKMVLTAAPHADELPVTPLAVRLSDAELAAAAVAPDPASGNPSSLPLGFVRNAPLNGGPVGGGRGGAAAGRGGRGAGGAGNFRAQLAKFWKDEGVLVLVIPGGGTADGGTIMGQGQVLRTAADEAPLPTVIIANEHYNRITRLLEKSIPVSLEFDIQTKFTDVADSYNITAEIPGTDPRAGLVMVGGHFDSWTGGTGATDNGAGAAIAMESVRILKSLNLKTARTIRVGLWTGEEQGLLGSRAYVKEHFADPADMKPKPEHAKLAAYFNLDNGGGKIRGIYMQDNDEMRPIFEAWLEPFKDLGASTLTIRNTGSTDHVSFDSVGLPAFQFIQDPLDYGTRTHHSNMDVYDRLQVNDMEQASAVEAWCVYNAAVRPEMLPRKPMPKPGAGRGGRGQ